MSYYRVRCCFSFLLLASFLPFASPACLIRSVHHVYSNASLNAMDSIYLHASSSLFMHWASSILDLPNVETNTARIHARRRASIYADGRSRNRAVSRMSGTAFNSASILTGRAATQLSGWLARVRAEDDRSSCEQAACAMLGNPDVA